MGSLFRNILLLPGRLLVAFLRAAGLAPPAPRLCIRRPRPSPLVISVSAFFWGSLLLAFPLIALKPGPDNSEPPGQSLALTHPEVHPPPAVTADQGESSPDGESDPQVEPQAPEVWLVILHSIPKRAQSEADRREARAEADRRAVNYKRQGLDAQVFDTDSFPRLKGGFWAVALGPFETRQSAHQIGDLLREQAPGLMVRRVI